MSIKSLAAIAVSLVFLTACTQTDNADYSAPERGDAQFLKGKNTRADELYINTESPAGGRDYRDVYIAPADLSRLLVIQPEGGDADEQWQVTEVEEGILQRAIASEFSAALGYESAYNVVDSMDDAEIVVHTTVVAIHPNASKAAVAAGARAGGAITVSIALVNKATGTVLIRSVDTKSSDDIWAFNQVENDDSAVNLIFRAWGNSMRRGILQLQGRSSDPLAPVINLKQQ